MAIQNFLIMNLLRLITPEEIGDIATKHNGGKFLSLTDLVRERAEHKIYRDFTSPESMEEIHEAHLQMSQAKILPFKKIDASEVESGEGAERATPLNSMAIANLGNNEGYERSSESIEHENIEHAENENMSSFILIEKARLKRSQQTLKQKEIINLYQKNATVDVEQIKGSNSDLTQSSDTGVLVNKKHY